jgi:uncharacterized protein YcbK (DUF882 family)
VFFERSEFSCQCGCGFNTVDYELMNVLNKMRLYYDCPIIITSGSRCDLHNKNVGGVNGSYHTKGKAVDFKVKGVSPLKVFEYLKETYPNKYGKGLYSSWCHIDVREDSITWEG